MEYAGGDLLYCPCCSKQLEDRASGDYATEYRCPECESCTRTRGLTERAFHADELAMRRK